MHSVWYASCIGCRGESFLLFFRRTILFQPFFIREVPFIFCSSFWNCCWKQDLRVQEKWDFHPHHFFPLHSKIAKILDFARRKKSVTIKSCPEARFSNPPTHSVNGQDGYPSRFVVTSSRKRWILIFRKHAHYIKRSYNDMDKSTISSRERKNYQIKNWELWDTDSI
jgi:hypothetical protein